jgi:molybdate transport system substrate-binding protein
VPSITRFGAIKSEFQRNGNLKKLPGKVDGNKNNARVSRYDGAVMKMRIFWLILALFSLLAPNPAAAQNLTVAAAADLQAAMPELVAQYQQQTGKSVQVVYGSSGNFYQQIQNGAPFDLFFSANLDYAKKLDAAGLAEPGSLYEYATGKIVLWVPLSSKIDLSAGLKALLDPAVKKVAIANPEHAPYGQAAVAAMQKAGVYDQLKSKLVMGENISQAASFVVGGAADAGIVALSLALSPNMKDKGHYAEIPPADYPAITQACVIVKASTKQAEARAFLDFVKSEWARDLLKRYGFAVPLRNAPK